MTHVTNRREECRSTTPSVTTNQRFCRGFALLRQSYEVVIPQFYEIVIPRVSAAEARGICSSPRSRNVPSSGKCRQMRQCLAHLFFRVLVINELVRKILFIRRHIEISVTAEVEQDGLLLALFLRLQRLVDGAAHRMRSLGCNDDSLGLGKSNRSFETLQLCIADRLHNPLAVQQADRKSVV